MKRHTGVHAVIVAILLSVCLGGASSALGKGKGVARPYYPSGFAPGARVTLLEDDPAAGSELKKGRSGTIVCCDAPDGSGSILVSWDLYAGGKDEEGNCATERAGLYVPGSTKWINPAQVKLGLSFNEVGILQEDAEGCAYLTTYDGRMYYIVGGLKLGGGAWFPKLAYNARVRGLLNRSPVDAGRTCQQRDGDVYHPIVAIESWDYTLCADRWVCGFDYGDRVVLISESNPYGATNLPRGATGTIICGRYEPGRSLLVSWDLWTEGGDDEAYATCHERVSGLFPPGSTWWVSVKDIAKVFETKCGFVQEIGLCVNNECLDPKALGLFAWFSDVYYLAGLEQVSPPSGRVMATGLFTRYGQLLNGQVEVADTVIRQDLAGMILNPIIISCPEPSCCQPAYVPGDRVELLVDEPGGAHGLLTGASGTVICCNPDDPIAPIFVSWDDWIGGDDNDEACDQDTNIRWYPERSGWWMACSEIDRLVLADLYNVKESVQGFLPGSLVAGKEGQILKISGTVGNRGGTQSESFFTGVYLSSDRNITRSDYQIGWISMQLDPRGRASLDSNVLFPVYIPAGTYYLGWVIDAENAVQEGNENNNVAFIEWPLLTVTEP